LIVLHGLRACDACRGALRDLEMAGRPVRLRDLRASPPTAEEVALWLGRCGPSLVNRRSTTWRRLTEAERNRDPAELLLAYPTLIKRPLVEAPAGVMAGWTAATRVMLGMAA
jgi:arsenate reductase